VIDGDSLPATLQTDRLDVVALDASLARALSDGDVRGAERQLGARFPSPFVLPPLLAADISRFADALTKAPHQTGWWGWLVIRRDVHTVVGFVLSALPGADGFSLLGWSVYPWFERNGYATETMRAVLQWLFEHDAVAGARATIPLSFTASRRVAEKLGLIHVRSTQDAEHDHLAVYEIPGD
jgi:RimJ/RimL family protein N-acetyltransferase